MVQCSCLEILDCQMITDDGHLFGLTSGASLDIGLVMWEIELLGNRSWWLVDHEIQNSSQRSAATGHPVRRASILRAGDPDLVREHADESRCFSWGLQISCDLVKGILRVVNHLGV